MSQDLCSDPIFYGWSSGIYDYIWFLEQQLFLHLVRDFFLKIPGTRASNCLYVLHALPTAESHSSKGDHSWSWACLQKVKGVLFCALLIEYTFFLATPPLPPPPPHLHTFPLWLDRTIKISPSKKLRKINYAKMTFRQKYSKQTDQYAAFALCWRRCDKGSRQPEQ